VAATASSRAGNYWLHAKLVLVAGAIGYHHACRSLLRKFEEFANEKSERWFRVFNETRRGAVRADRDPGGRQAVLMAHSATAAPRYRWPGSMPP
jgi:hypothetical protein